MRKLITKTPFTHSECHSVANSLTLTWQLAHTHLPAHSHSLIPSLILSAAHTSTHVDVPIPASTEDRTQVVAADIEGSSA